MRSVYETQPWEDFRAPVGVQGKKHVRERAQVEAIRSWSSNNSSSSSSSSSATRNSDARGRWAMETTQVASSSGVSLAVRVFRPATRASSRERKPVTVVLVHQYSLMGGCQELLRGMGYLLASRGFPTVTFDMRGVGGSSGKPSLTGTAEVQDVVAVAQWASQHCSATPVLLVGSSAGAPIAGAAIDAVKEVVGYVSLGYPFGVLASVLFGRHHKRCLQSRKPKLFVMGTTDGFTSVKQLESKLKCAAGRVETRLVEGAGHFDMEAPHFDHQMVDFISTFADSLLLATPDSPESPELL